jgi:RNA polymerase sigma-70 factor, ECF subfamily
MTHDDEAAAHFDVLYRSFYPYLARSAYLIVLDYEVAQELAHEAYLRLWRRHSKLVADSNERAWLMRVVTNLAISYRRSLRVRWRKVEPPPPQPDAIDLALQHLELRQMRAALLRLNPRERAILSLRFDQELSFPEIGSIIGRPEATVKTWCHRAMARLRAELVDGGLGSSREAPRSVDHG